MRMCMCMCMYKPHTHVYMIFNFVCNLRKQFVHMLNHLTISTSSDNVGSRSVMKLNLSEIAILSIRPVIDDNSSLYAKVVKTKYHIPRGKRHRVGESTVVLTTDVLGNVGDEISWTIISTENTIETVAEKKVAGQDPNDDFLFDETSKRARGKHIKAQTETFSSSFELGKEEDLSVSICKQWYEGNSKVPSEALIGTATIQGSAIRDHPVRKEDEDRVNEYPDAEYVYIVRDIARQDLYGFASIHFSLERRIMQVDEKIIEDEEIEEKDQVSVYC